MTLLLTHNKARLALHELREGAGRPLLILHGLGGHSPERVPVELETWPGPVFALDFTGHGQSTVPAGGGYTAEILMGDADMALWHVGSATVVGYGLGAYVALMIAGGRSERVHGAILCDGHGLDGGGTEPGAVVVRGVPERMDAPDPFALVELSSDLRPPDYAAAFAKLARQGSQLDHPISVCARGRPEWLQEVLRQPGVRETTMSAALHEYSR